MMTHHFKSLLKSFYYAFKGLLSCIYEERNFRIHLTAVVWVLFFCHLGQLSVTQSAILALCCGIVVVCELFNTAMERLVDLISPEFSPLAGKIKDITAGAVLVSALLSLVVGYLLFIPTGKLLEIFHLLCHLPFLSAQFVVLLLASLLFIFYFRKKSKS